MYTATIFTDSPALQACRALLVKQRLAWEEERIELYSEKLPAVKISVADTTAKLKTSRTPKKPKPATNYPECTLLPNGHYSWVYVNGRTITAPFAFDPKAYEKQRAITRQQLNRRLTGNFTDEQGDSLGHRDFSPFFKE